MLTAQVEDFESSERLLELVLGCLSVGERVVDLLEIPGHPPRGRKAERATHVLLGLISFQRTLLAVSGADSTTFGEDDTSGSKVSPHREQRVLR